MVDGDAWNKNLLRENMHYHTSFALIRDQEKESDKNYFFMFYTPS